MNRSEKVTSALAQLYFFDELVHNNLQFNDSSNQTKELADIIVNLEDVIIAIQIKERDNSFQTHDVIAEQKWFDNKISKAKHQMNDTIKYIREGKLPFFKDTMGIERKIQSDAEIIPLVIFFNDTITNYPHLLKKNTESGISVNCISFKDFQKMCSVLLTPGEIIDYLKYRYSFYEKYEQPAFHIDNLNDSESIISRPASNETLVYHYLADRYGVTKPHEKLRDLEWLKKYTQESLNRSIAGRANEGTYAVLLFLAHLRRNEIILFRERIYTAWRRTSEKKYGIVGSLRNNSFVAFFVSSKHGQAYSMKYLLELAREKCNPKLLLQIYVWWENQTNFRIDYLLMRTDNIDC